MDHVWDGRCGLAGREARPRLGARVRRLKSGRLERHSTGPRAEPSCRAVACRFQLLTGDLADAEEAQRGRQPPLRDLQRRSGEVRSCIADRHAIGCSQGVPQERAPAKRGRPSNQTAGSIRCWSIGICCGLLRHCRRISGLRCCWSASKTSPTGRRRHRQRRLLLPPNWSTRAIGDRGHRG